MAAAYLIANLRITDPERFDQYRQQVSPMIARFGGRYLVRGGKVEERVPKRAPPRPDGAR